MGRDWPVNSPTRVSSYDWPEAAGSGSERKTPSENAPKSSAFTDELPTNRPELARREPWRQGVSVEFPHRICARFIAVPQFTCRFGPAKGWRGVPKPAGASAAPHSKRLPARRTPPPFGQVVCRKSNSFHHCLLKMDDTALQGSHGSLSSRRNAKTAENDIDVAFHGTFGDTQVGRNFPIAFAFHDQR
jgi:hypothetical protein